MSTKLCTIVHELSHAVSRTNDLAAGRQNCLNLATNDPAVVINNGDNSIASFQKLQTYLIMVLIP